MRGMLAGDWSFGRSGKWNLRNVSPILMALSATGIIPIFYRLLSRCSLSTRGDVDKDTEQQSSSGSIFDLLVLSALCALVFVPVELPEQFQNYYSSPLVDLLHSIVLSILLLIALRLNARCAKVTMFANLVLVSAGGFTALLAAYWGLDQAGTGWLDNEDWFGSHLAMEFRAGLTGITTVMIALFPIVARGCGVSLQLSHSKTLASGAGASDNAANAPTGKPKTRLIQRAFSAVSVALGHASVILLISMITIYPFTWTDGPFDGGYRTAGWPLTYWSEIKSTTRMRLGIGQTTRIGPSRMCVRHRSCWTWF